MKDGSVQRRENFSRVFFPESVVREAAAVLKKNVAGVGDPQWRYPTILEGAVSWEFDSDSEFFAQYSANASDISLWAEFHLLETPYTQMAQMHISYKHGQFSVMVRSPKLADVLAPFAVFRSALEKYQIPDPPMPELPPLKIFIGHGRSSHWRDLKDSLQDHHGFDVEAFETQPRAGYTIPEVIDGMARNNTLALMVMTAEDEQKDGSTRARENVVHEVGYFQGRLGSKRAILIMEEGVNEFSNIHGIVHLPYKNIREVVGDVLAIIKREFPHTVGR